MGKPATTYWCENGHLLEHNNAHVFGELDWVTEDFDYDNPRMIGGVLELCDICKSCKVVWSLDWGDPDHLDLKTLQFEVPLTPIKHEEVEKVDNRGNKYYIEVPVYDVSRLLAKKHDN